MSAHDHTLAAAPAAGPGSPGPAAPVLEVRGLVKDYDGQRALDRMDFAVRAGEIHALLGENGAGKSTLIKAVAGAIDVDEGEILVDGRQVRPSDPQEGRQLGIAVVHQHGNLVPALTVAENLMLGERFPRRAGLLIDRRGLRAQVRDLLEQVQLDVRPDQPVSTLRPHEAGMLAVAKALRLRSRIVILDEPTTAFTPTEVAILFERLRALAAQGTAFVYVSHRLAEVLEIAGRMTIMREGRLVGTWSRDELDHESLVDKLVGDRRIAARHADERRAQVVAHGEPLLQVRDLRADCVHGVDLTLHRGEVLGLASLPRNGAAEVLGALFGTVERHGGEVELDGRDVSASSPAEAREAGFALIPKDRHAQAVLPGISIRRNLTVASTAKHRTDPLLRLIRRRSEREAAGRQIEGLHIKAGSDARDIATLSGGNQQKVVIGRWLARESRVFLFDDPCAGIDIQSKGEIYQMIEDLAGQGTGVIVTSTELEELVRACHRVLVLHEGRIAGELVGDEINEQNIMRLSFGPAAGKESINGSRR